MALAKHSNTPAKINRRQLFAAAPAAVMIGAAPAIAMADAETPIAVLFTEWKKLSVRSNDPALSEDEFQILYARCGEVEKRLVALPSENMADLARKIIAHTGDGDFTLDGERADPIWQEMRGLAI